VGPTYLCFGVEMALYFAAQGAGQVRWPLLAVTGRLLMTAGGVWAAARLLGAGLTAIFVINALGLTLLGVAMLIAFKARLLR
jgi:MATE family, multidrug efflux pump